MKAIQLLLNSELPPDLRDYTRELDSKSIGALMTDVARKYPDQYERISKVISDFGRKASYFQGETLNLNDTRPVIDKDLLFKAMDAEIDDARKSTKNDAEFTKLKMAIWDKYNTRLEKETGKAALAQGNNLGYTVVSGARGKMPQLKMMLTTPGLYTDADDNIIPIFIRNSFSEGLRPAEYMASTYGARKSVLCLAINTQVRMADGSIRNIQDINIGEYVLGSDKDGNTFPTQVINTFEQGQQRVYELLLSKHSPVVCTMEHKFLVNKSGVFKILPARSIFCNDAIVGSNADGPINIHLLYMRPAGEVPCYDIEVEHEDHLFVLANGVVTSNSTKRATAKGGDFSKQMAQTAVNILVSENNCGVTNGIDLDINDKSIRGRVLAREVDGMPAGTVLDKDAIAQLRKNKVNTLIVRSPMTCQAKEGVCAKCMGLNAQGRFPRKGEAVGITAANAIGEPITQMALNTKHCINLLTEVRMGDGSVKAIKDILVGDEVLGLNKDYTTSPCRVTANIDQGIQDTYKYSLALGKNRTSDAEVICTEDHIFIDEYNNINKISQSKKLLCGGSRVPDSTWINEPMAMAVGFFIGDGIRFTMKGESTHVKVSCAYPCIAEEFKTYLSQFDLSLVKRKRSHDWAISSSKTLEHTTDKATGRFIKTGALNPLKKLLISLGYSEVYCHEKIIHPDIFKWDNKSIADLISGYLTTDGCIYPDGNGVWAISFGSSSRPLLEGIKYLLLSRFGIGTNALTRINKAGKKDRVHDMWAFCIRNASDVNKFCNNITRPLGYKGVKFDLLRKQVEDSTQHNVFYRVTKIEHIGPTACRDLTVDNETNMFILANGVATHNTAGAAQTGKREWSGFDYINQFVQSPETFPDKAILAKEDGQVTKITEAPQGGYYVNVNNIPHYVAPGYPLLVKVGDKLEAGDELSEGLADPGEIVDLKGLGEGRKYYANKLKELLDNSGMEADRRNTEMMARAALNHLQITDVKDGDQYLPDDVVNYSYFSNNYVPPKNTVRTPLNKANGQYLQTPILHYTIGTKITPKITEHLSKVGFNEIYTSPDNPSFKPHMVRLRTASHQGSDWLAAMHTSYLKKQLSDSAIRGDSTNIESNSHFAPRLAIGVNFGDNIEQTGKF